MLEIKIAWINENFINYQEERINDSSFRLSCWNFQENIKLKFCINSFQVHNYALNRSAVKAFPRMLCAFHRMYSHSHTHIHKLPAICVHTTSTHWKCRGKEDGEKEENYRQHKTHKHAIFLWPAERRKKKSTKHMYSTNEVGERASSRTERQTLRAQTKNH